MHGVGVENLIETLLRSEGSLERESKVENIFRPLIRDAWVNILYYTLIL